MITRTLPLILLMILCGFFIQTFYRTPAPQAIAGPTIPGFDANIFVNLSKKVVPSVVNISTFTTTKGRGAPLSPEDFFHRFFEDMYRQGRPGGPGSPDDDEDDSPKNFKGPRGKNGPRAMSLGTGFIIDAAGLILTNNHVVADADEIKINFTESTDEKPTDGEVVGRDPEIDVALIKVKSKREMTPVILGDSDALEVGEYVMAVGNPFGQGHSVTHGIVSAKGRNAPELLAKYIQTDAPINPGNSGGPLVNLRGEVIGINNAIDQRAQGIGFAIPINYVKKVLPQLKNKGTVARGYIGIIVGELTPEIANQVHAPKDLQAPLVTQVNPGEPADKAGIKPYDIIIEVNGKEIHNSSDLITAITAVNVGDSVQIKVLRSSESKTFQVKVAQRPTTFAQAKTQAPKNKGKGKSRIDTGMQLEELTPEIRKELGLAKETQGIVVSSVSYGSPADKAGLIRGDVILEIDRKPVKDVDSFYASVKDKKSYLVRVQRSDPQGREGFLVIVLDLKEVK